MIIKYDINLLSFITFHHSRFRKGKSDCCFYCSTPSEYHQMRLMGLQY